MQVLNIKKATPMFTGLITTADRYSEAESRHGGIIDTTKLNQIKDLQKIVSVSEQAKARGLDVGDVILLDFKRYAERKQKKDSLKESMDEHYNAVLSYNIPTILIGYVEHLLLDISDISLKIDEYSFDTEGEGILSGEKELKLRPSGLIL